MSLFHASTIADDDQRLREALTTSAVKDATGLDCDATVAAISNAVSENWRSVTQQTLGASPDDTVNPAFVSLIRKAIDDQIQKELRSVFRTNRCCKGCNPEATVTRF